MNKMYSDGEYKLEIENLPVNRYGKARIFIENIIANMAEKLEEHGVKVARVELKGDDE